MHWPRFAGKHASAAVSCIRRIQTEYHVYNAPAGFELLDTSRHQGQYRVSSQLSAARQTVKQATRNFRLSVNRMSQKGIRQESRAPPSPAPRSSSGRLASSRDQSTGRSIASAVAMGVECSCLQHRRRYPRRPSDDTTALEMDEFDLLMQSPASSTDDDDLLARGELACVRKMRCVVN